jgi:hypothetical protein
MALPTARLVVALRETAARLRSPDATYRWSHFGHCNCGHLAQTMTGLSAAAVYRAAFQGAGDWGQQAAAMLDGLDWGDRPGLDEGAFEPEVMRCGSTGRPLDAIFGEMAAFGLDRRDFDALEDLSDGDVLRRMGRSTTGLERNVRENVVAYLEAWADVVAERLDDLERARLADLDEPLPIAAEEE